jgi:hypothetical protein
MLHKLTQDLKNERMAVLPCILRYAQLACPISSSLQVASISDHKQTMFSKLKSKLAASHGDKYSKDVNTAPGRGAGKATAPTSSQTASLPIRESATTTKAQKAQPSELTSEVVTGVTDRKAAATTPNSSKVTQAETCSTHVIQATKPVSTESSSVTLWDRAYSQLSAEKQDLMEEYTQLLSDALKTSECFISRIWEGRELSNWVAS